MRRIRAILFTALILATMFAGTTSVMAARILSPASSAATVQIAAANLPGETPVTVDNSNPQAPKLTCPKGAVAVSGAFGDSGKCLGSTSQNPIYVLLDLLIRFLSGMFGLVLVLILVIAGFQYIISNGSPDDTKSAKNRLKAAVTGFILYIVMIGALQLILPTDAKLFGP